MRVQYGLDFELVAVYVTFDFVPLVYVETSAIDDYCVVCGVGNDVAIFLYGIYDKLFYGNHSYLLFTVTWTTFFVSKNSSLK